MDPHIPSDSQSLKDAHKELRCDFSKKSLKRTKRKGSMHWQRALHIFWQDHNNEREASCSIAWFLFHFSIHIFSLYLLFYCLSKTELQGLKYYKQSWIRLIDKKNEIHWFQENVSPLNASFFIDLCVLITALSANHIATQVRTKVLESIIKLEMARGLIQRWCWFSLGKLVFICLNKLLFVSCSLSSQILCAKK